MADRGYIVKPQGNLFKKLDAEITAAGIERRTKQSMHWFRRRAHNIRRVNRRELMTQEEVILKNRTIMGSMFMWFYDPKHKKTLPYYDSFPLGIIVDKAPGGFYALNLHYLPPILRAKFLDTLIETTNKKYDHNSKMKVRYKLLKDSARMKLFKPCFKHYLTKHVRSRFAMVQPEDWELVSFLPMADWQKAGAHQVYRDAREMVK